MTDNRFTSINIHITDACNYSCAFCFSSRSSCSSGGMIGFDRWMPILSDLVENRGITKINFAGGEPHLHPDLKQCIYYSKSLGATTSLVTNGSLVDREFFLDTYGDLDWIGLSIDSVDDYKEVMMGRHCPGCRHLEKVKLVSDYAHDHGVKVKLNVVVNRMSFDEDFTELIERIDPQRVKFLQISKVRGVNDFVYDYYSITDLTFEDFKKRHSGIRLSNGSSPVSESESDIKDSYLMLDSSGNFRIRTESGYFFVPYDVFWMDPEGFGVNYERYVNRAGLYDWSGSGNGGE